ncbi:MAG: hypothetical protein V4530_16485 [Pseudomonadota bacterium]|jgi:hypothetical protein
MMNPITEKTAIVKIASQSLPIHCDSKGPRICDDLFPAGTPMFCHAYETKMTPDAMPKSGIIYMNVIIRALFAAS